MLRQLERDLFPWIGDRPIEQIHAMELLAALQKVEERGALETADRALMLARQIWDYWLPTKGVAQRNITEGLKARLTPYQGKSFATIVEPNRFGDLMQTIRTYKGGPIVRTALPLAPLWCIDSSEPHLVLFVVSIQHCDGVAISDLHDLTLNRRSAAVDAAHC